MSKPYLISEREDIPSGETYPTTDKKLAVALMSRNHEPLKVFGIGRKITFIFLDKEIRKDRNAILTGKNFSVDIHSVWAAETVWGMCLTQLKEAGKNAQKPKDNNSSRS